VLAVSPDRSIVAVYDQETGWGSFVHLPIAFAPSSTLFGYGRSDATVVVAHNP